MSGRLSLDLSSTFAPQQASELRSPEDINLNLYNFDKVDATDCPYVLTSPRSLEACANLGIKPVELLSKSFEEFREELPSYTPFDEVKHLFKLFEIQRTKKLERCRKEREYIIHVERMRKQRSQSVSPGRRRHCMDMPLLEVVMSSDEDQCSSSRTDACTPPPPSTPGGDSHTTAESIDDQFSEPEHAGEPPRCSSAAAVHRPPSRSPIHNNNNHRQDINDDDDDECDAGNEQKNVSRSLVDKKSRSGHRPTPAPRGMSVSVALSSGTIPRSKSTPTSPYHRNGFQQLMAISSPGVREVLNDNPRVGTRLPAKDIKLLEVMVRRREVELEAEERRREAHRKWEEEREEARRRREDAAKTRSLRRVKNAPPKQLQGGRSASDVCGNSEQGTKRVSKSQPSTPDFLESETCSNKSRNSSNDDGIESGCSHRHKGTSITPHMLSERIAQMQEALHAASKVQRTPSFKANEMSYGDSVKTRIRQLEDRMKTKDFVAVQPTYRQMNTDVRRSAQALEERIAAAKKNQHELDRALDVWRQKVSEYQVASNSRAQERVKELVEERRRRAQIQRETKELEHRRNLQKVSVLEGERLKAMIERLKQKEERARHFTFQKQQFIEQSRALAKASSDLREHLRYKAERDVMSSSMTSSSRRTSGRTSAATSTDTSQICSATTTPKTRK